MRILQLINDFSNPLYQEQLSKLVNSLDYQTVFFPRRFGKIDKRKLEIEKVRLIDPLVVRPYMRLLLPLKINTLYSILKKSIQNEDYNLVHAHTLFSDGGLAAKLQKDTGCDFVVTIRNTDINLFYKYIPIYRKLGHRIMLSAKRIIFLNPSHLNLFLGKMLPSDLGRDLRQKSVVIPNGISEFWHNHKTRKTTHPKSVRLIYYGKIEPNKNIDIIIKVAIKLKNLGYPVSLTLIGNGRYRRYFNRIIKKISTIPYIEYFPFQESKHELRKSLNQSDIFLMPSKTESFGLSYIEAMSQGLPVLYSRNQGIDGFFTDGYIGYAVNPKDIDDIIGKILAIMDDFLNISQNCLSILDRFKWNNVCDNLLSVYRNSIDSSKIQ